jgi:hypothetical protein
MIIFLILIIIFIFIYNYKTIDYFNSINNNSIPINNNSIPNNDNVIQNKNILNKYFTNNRKIL